MKRSSLDRYRVLHFATHGLISHWSPERSALVLAASGRAEDGFLQVREIHRLKLESDLVVLSACQTAGGKLQPGEGAQGLARAFLHAGARSVVASLWRVHDARTSELMASFYRHLADGQTKSKALRSAKLDLLRKNPGLGPRYWAPFILIGEPEDTIPLAMHPRRLEWRWSLPAVLLAAAFGTIFLLVVRRKAQV